MGMYLISPEQDFAAMVKTALKTEDLKTFATATDLIQHLLEKSCSTSDVAILELNRLPETTRFINFVKGSPRISSLKVLAIGTEEQLLALDAGTIGKAEGKLRMPFSPAELTAMVAKVTGRHE
jgi:hypothetical protein